MASKLVQSYMRPLCRVWIHFPHNKKQAIEVAERQYKKLGEYAHIRITEQKGRFGKTWQVKTVIEHQLIPVTWP